MNLALFLTLSAGIMGHVTDARQVPVGAAVVTVTKADSGWRCLILTNARGQYTLAHLPPGRYEVEAVKPGLKVAARMLVTVRPGPPQAVDLRMTKDMAVKTVALQSVIP